MNIQGDKKNVTKTCAVVSWDRLAKGEAASPRVRRHIGLWSVAWRSSCRDVLYASVCAALVPSGDLGEDGWGAAAHFSCAAQRDSETTRRTTQLL